MKSAIVAIAVALVLFAPAANAQDLGIMNPNVSTPTTLYMHLAGFQNFPINTQQPRDDYAVNTGIGTATHSSSCLRETLSPTSTSLLYQEFHTFYGYSSPGYVQYDVIENGVPRFHPERGLSYDVKWDREAKFDLYFYFSSQTGLQGDQGNQVDPQAVPPMPNVVVEANMRASDTISVGDAKYNDAPLLATGKTNPVTIVQTPSGAQMYPASDQVTIAKADDGRTVYGFKVPMEIKEDVIPELTGYNLRIDIYMDNEACEEPYGGKIMNNFVKLHSSPAFRPRMELSIMNPITIEYLHPQFVGDDMVIHTSSNSPWGNYDVAEVNPYTPNVDASGIVVTVEGPSAAPSLQQAAIVQRTNEHDHHTQAVDVTYVWPYKTDGAQNGKYTVDFSVKNDQMNAVATARAEFEIGKGIVTGCGAVERAEDAQRNNDKSCESQIQPEGRLQNQDSPGIGLFALLGVLAVAMLLRRKA